MRIACFELTAPGTNYMQLSAPACRACVDKKKTTNSHALNSDCVGGTTASSRRRLLGWKDWLCHVLIVPVKHFGVRLPLVRLALSCANRLDLMTTCPGFRVRVWSGAAIILCHWPVLYQCVAISLN